MSPAEPALRPPAVPAAGARNGGPPPRDGEPPPRGGGQPPHGDGRPPRDGGGPRREGEQRLLSGWGRTAPTRARVVCPRTAEEVAEALAGAGRPRGGAIARGAGRAYGDAAQNGGGTVIDARGLEGPLQVDGERALLRVGAGRTFAEVLAHLAVRGLTLPVVPGTRHLTVGGALAADVHGKNHLHDGSFARHVESLRLCTPAEGPCTVSAAEDRELFEATLGGMGLTGVVTEAQLRLAPLRCPSAVADVERLDTLEQALARLPAAPHRYAIAWVDLLSEGAAFGRSVLTLSEEGPAARGDESPPAPAAWAEEGPAARGDGNPPARRPAGPPFALRPRLTVPRGFPGGVLRPAAVRAFNAAHWRAAPRRERGRTLSMSAQLFPLDVLGEWSRMYGPSGLVQYQFAVPAGGEETLLRVVRTLRARRQPMYLAVLKRFGAGAGGPLSFPLPGLTLAIDLPAAAEGLHAALEEADELVAGAGGRVYLAKDSRLRPATLRAMYPELERLREVRGRVDPDGTLSSDMGRRLGLCEPTGGGAGGAGAEGAGGAGAGTPLATAAGADRADGTVAPRRVLVLGGTSEIAAAIVHELAAEGPCEVALAGRDEERLRAAAEDLRAAGCARVETMGLQATEPDTHEAVLAHAIELLGGVELVVLAVGVLGERGGLPQDAAGAVEVLEVNTVGAGSLLLQSAQALRARGGGTIVVLSSVAAERARGANAVYCASKAGLDALAQGLGDALAGTGVRVVVVRPGFVRTRMTRGLPVPPLACDPEAVARATVRGLRRGAHTVWVPGGLRWVMAALRLTPRPLFRRLPL